MALIGLSVALFGAALLGARVAGPIAGQANGPAVTLAPGQITPMPTPLPGLLGPSRFPDGINPLTGLPADPSALALRPFVIKISNAPPIVRPQAGLGAADVVFEYYVEGGLTRFSAVFHSQLPWKVGSVRSARLIDDQLVPMFGALFAYSGASDGMNWVLTYADYAGRRFNSQEYGPPYFWRDETIEAPHNLFFGPDVVVRDFPEIAAGPVDLTGWAFRAEPPPNAAGPATRAVITYKVMTGVWDYNPASGLYVRSSDGLGHYDGTTLQPITAANVLILYAHYTPSDIVESEWQGQPIYGWDIDLMSGGEALLLRDGLAYAARWTRPERDGLFRLFTPDGGVLPFRPGNTWVEVFPPPAEQEAPESVVVQ